jgi:hypothetical protein
VVFVHISYPNYCHGYISTPCRSAADYQVLISATNEIDEVVWNALWRHLSGNPTHSFSLPECPIPGGGPVDCGVFNKEIAETRAFVVQQSLSRHGYGIVPSIRRCQPADYQP